MKFPRKSSTLSAALVVMTLTGCTVGPKYNKPAAIAPTSPNYRGATTDLPEGQGWKVASPSDQMLHGKWWEIFQEPELNELEDQLNINNQNIKVFFENYMAARAIIREARAQYYPTVSVGFGYSRSKQSGNLSAQSGNVAGNGQQFSEFSLPVDISWAPDLFGRVRSTVRANEAAAQLSAADLENERLLEQASLAEFYFQIRGQDL